MAEFASLYSYWKFEQSVKAKAKCIGERPALLHGEHDEEAKEFLRMVLETSASREITLRSCSRLFRVQLEHDQRTEPVKIGFGEDDEAEMVEFETACSAERMLPDAKKVGDGRANRKGTPYLYLAEKPQTALAEMRPWVSSLVTLAMFILTRDCRVIDCSRNTMESMFHEVVDLGMRGVTSESDALTKEEGVWGDIGNAFSKPVASDEIIEYVPTQALAAEFQSHGYDGIAYKSLLDGGGNNVVLFNIKAAKQLPSRCLYKTKAVSYEFARADDNPAWPASIHSQYCQK